MGIEKTAEEQADLDKRTARGDFVDDDLTEQGRAENETEEEKAARLAAEAEKGGGEGDDDDPDKKKDDKPAKPDVPYSRFAEVNEKFGAEREARLLAEGEARALRQQLTGKKPAAAAADDDDGAADPNDPAPGVYDPRRLREMAGEAILEGDVKKYTALNNKADDIIEARSTERATDMLRRETAATSMASVESELYEAYPFLNHKSAEADRSAITRVIALRDTLIRDEGMAPADALREAAETVGDRVAAAKGLPGRQSAAPDDTPGKARNGASLKKAAEAANHQPSIASGGKGERSRATVGDGGVDVAKLTDKQFRDLPEAEKARLRGDVVA